MVSFRSIRIIVLFSLIVGLFFFIHQNSSKNDNPDWRWTSKFLKGVNPVSVNPTLSPPKLLLIGIFSTAGAYARRALIRILNTPSRPEQVRTMFIIGKTQDVALNQLLAYESRVYKDIFIVDCTENMNNGKTYQFFKDIHATFPSSSFKYVMKTDDDSYIHYPNLIKYLEGIQEDWVYFGRAQHHLAYPYMGGYGFGVSWDLVEYFATDPFPPTSTVGFEDYMAGSWVTHRKSQGLPVYFANDDVGDRYYHYVKSKENIGEWTDYFITNETIICHRLKTDALWLHVTSVFSPLSQFPVIKTDDLKEF